MMNFGVASCLVCRELIRIKNTCVFPFAVNENETQMACPAQLLLLPVFSHFVLKVLYRRSYWLPKNHLNLKSHSERNYVRPSVFLYIPSYPLEHETLNKRENI